MSLVFEDEEAAAGRLFDVLAKFPDGLDMRELCTHLDLTPYQVSIIVRRLRLVLADGGMNVPIRREGKRQVYHLASSTVEGAAWQETRSRTMRSRLDVDIAWWTSMAHATGGRTSEGRVARSALRQLKRLREDLSDVLPGSG